MRKLFTYVVSIIFFLSATAKLIDYDNTALYFSSITTMSPEFMRIILAIIILIEFVVSLGLSVNLFNIRYFQNLLLSISVIFLLTSLALSWNNKINCGCFGTMILVNPLIAVIKNCFIIVMLLILRKMLKSKRSESY
jgi:hypothetical protein